MAENKGKTKGSMIAAIQSAQIAVGAALKGGQAAVAGGSFEASGLLQTHLLLEDLRDIGIENEKNTQSMFSILKNMFVFDKDAARRLRDQMAEKNKEKKGAPAPSVIQDVKSLKDTKGPGWVLGSVAGLVALAAFMKSINVEDILRLPQQVKSIKGIATFVKGITKLGTLGLGARFIDNISDSLKLFKTNFGLRLTELKASALSKFKGIKFPSFVGLADEIKKLNFVTHIRESKAFKGAVTALKGIKTGIAGIVTPMVNAFQGVFGGVAGPAGRGAASGMRALFAPLRAIGRVIGKLFLPITIIMGIFDGYQGFMDEFEKEGSILDGIRGAVTGIVDGFIGGLVRLVTNVIGWMLEKLGLEHLATVITDFGIDITASFSTAVGGLVDFVTGIFSLDLKRITEGLVNLVGGTANFMFTVITTPINAAIALVSSIFKWGDPENPFTVKGFLFGDGENEGVIPKIISWFKGLFSFDFTGMKEKLFDMAGTFKAIVAASAAAVKAGFPGGESPGEAYQRVFEAMTSGNTTADVKNDGNEIAKSVVTDVKGNTTETNYKTTTINEGGKLDGGTTVVYNDNSAKNVSNVSSTKEEIYSGSLNTETDNSNAWRNGMSRYGKKSDRRLKEDIKLEGKSPSGVNIYSFKYKEQEGRYKGVMAQEVLKAAIFNIPGYLMVDYSKLDVDFAKI